MKIIIPDDYIERKLIYKKEHPTKPLYIYNYSPEVQFSRLWDEYTSICRGLILDENNNVVARPIPKFFNLGEIGLDNLPKEPYIITEKIDGSMIIIVRYQDELLFASRGSFISDQAIKAKEIFNSKYAQNQILPDKTFLFEVIYPENRIVVNYDDKEDLIGLVTVDNETGKSQEMSSGHGFPVAKQYPSAISIKDLQTLDDTNKEGFVVRFTESDFRVKIKFDEYVRLHKIVTNLSEKTVWESLRDGNEMSELDIPDEFMDWLKTTSLEFKKKYRNIVNKCKIDFQVIKKRPCLFKERKDIAEYFNKKKYPGILFAMLDNRDYSEIVWKLIKPKKENECNIKTCL